MLACTICAMAQNLFRCMCFIANAVHSNLVVVPIGNSKWFNGERGCCFKAIRFVTNSKTINEGTNITNECSSCSISVNWFCSFYSELSMRNQFTPKCVQQLRRFFPVDTNRNAR